MASAVLAFLGILTLLFVGGAAWKLAGEKQRSRWFWTIATILFPLALPILVYLPEGSLLFSKPDEP